MLPKGLLDYPESPAVAHSVLVAPLAHKSVKNVCQRHNSRFHRDILTRKMVGIALTIPFFVVVMSDINRNVGKLLRLCTVEYLSDDLCALCGMSFHYLKFLRSKFAGFSENIIINGNFTQIVHRCRFYNVVKELV